MQRLARRFFVKLHKASQVILSYYQDGLCDMTENIPIRFVLLIYHRLHSEAKISSVRGLNSINILTCDLSDLFFWNFFKLTVNHFKAYLPRLLRSVVNEIFRKSHQSVRVAAVENLAVLAKAHESVACSALTVASRAERRNMVLFHKPANNLIKGSLVGNIKLLRIVGTLLLAIAADRCSRCAADLRNQEPFL